MSHIYVLALTGHKTPPFVVDGRRIEFIKVENLFAAVDRRPQPPTASETELRSQHEAVTAIFSRVEDLLPVRFGAWIERRELTEVVARQKTAIVDALELVRGRVQMTIRFVAHSPAVRQDRRSGDRPETGTAYLQRRRNMEPVMPPTATPIKNAVSHMVVAERVNPGSAGGAAYLYHLIARDGVAAYMAAMLPFQSETVTVSGPWPPFAFAPDPWP
ncbi:MAG: GvpL/GvpF family gas vesicle protein [Vicinamibacterales bacterium]